MSKNVDIEELEKQMRPGALSEQGFLGTKESLATVLAEDINVLEKLGVTCSQLANAVETILSIAMAKQDSDRKGMRERRTPFPNLYEPESTPKFSANYLPDTDKGYLVGKLHVFMTQWRGIQECPWGCHVDSKWASIDFLILNRESGEFFTGPGLIVHLIREHNFFEGKQTPYRVEPAKVVRVLEIPHRE